VVRSIRVWLLASCAGALTVALPAAAQVSAAGSAEEPGDNEISEIIVTAEKRADTASRIGMSISVLSADSLSKLRVDTAADLVRQVPGFTVTKAGSGVPIYNLRGVGFNTPNLSSTSPVGFYVDQVAYAFPYMASGPVFDIARVEVLKGPQGTLYGRNTTGGLVNFITAGPTDDAQGSVKADVGNYQAYGIEGFISGTLAPGLKARVAVKGEWSDKGWQKSVTRDDRLGEINRKAARGALQWDPANALTIVLGVNYWHDRSDTQAPQLAYFIRESPTAGRTPAEIAPSLLTNGARNEDADWTPDSYQPSPNTSAPRRPYRKNSRFYSVRLDATYRISDALSLTSLTGYSNLRRADGQNLNGTPFEGVSNALDGDIRSFSEEVRLSGEGERVNWIVGGYYAQDRVNEQQLVYLGDFSTANLLRQVAASLNDPRYTPLQIAEGFRVNRQWGTIRNRSISAFANLQVQATDSIKLTGGLRYTEDRSRQTACTADSQGNTAPVWNTAVARLVGLYPAVNVQPEQCLNFNSDFSGLAGLVRGKLSENNLSWRGAVNWTPTTETLLYASVARGYKSGAFPIIAASAARQYAPATQEKVTSYETGTKVRLGNANVTLAGFYNDYRDKQVFGAIEDRVFGRLERLVNIPKSETYGVEASVEWNVTRELALRGSGSYLRTKILRYNGFDSFGSFLDFAGDEFPNTPRVQLSGNVTHTARLNDGLRLRTNLDVSYQSRSHGDFSDTSSYSVFPPRGSTVRPIVDGRLFNIPSYALVNGSVALSDEKDSWVATLWMKTSQTTIIGRPPSSHAIRRSAFPACRAPSARRCSTITECWHDG